MNQPDREAEYAAVCPIAHGSSAYPNRIAVYESGTSTSYNELHQLVCAAQASLIDLQIHDGSRVSLLSENSLELLVTTFALFRLGAVACLLNSRLPDSLLAEQLDLLMPALHVSTADNVVLPSRTKRVGFTELERTSAEAGPAELPAQSSGRFTWNLSDPATVLFTSGSTGMAKAVLHDLGNHYYSAIASSSVIPLSDSDVWLLSLPMYHVGGLAIPFRCFLSGCAVRIAQPRDAPRLLARPGITHVSFVQAQLKRWLELGGAAGPAVKIALLGGSALSQGLVKEAIDRGLPVRLSYGLTEMSSQVATTRTDVVDPTSGLCGPVLPNVRVRIDPDGAIAVAGRTRFLGYLTEDGLEHPFDRDGWFRTSDVGHFEEDALRVTGRIDNMFISGGENIHPEPIEVVMARVEGVREVVVVPVADEEFGFRPVAVVDSVDGQPSAAKLKAAVASVLPAYMVPVRFLPWPEGSKSDTVSKVDRRMIREYAQRCQKDSLL